MMVRYPIPIAIYALAALIFLVASRRGGGLKCLLVASYCGVIVTSFTGGASGAIWAVEIFILLVGAVVIWRRPVPAFGSAWVSRLTYLMCAVFGLSVLVGLFRYDPSLEVLKYGAFTSVGGIPVNLLMGGYRLLVVVLLALAFAIPLRYCIGRSLFVQCLGLCWLLSVVLAVLGIVDFSGLADMAFSYRREAGYGRVAVLGFHRGAGGMMSVVGMLCTLAFAQSVRNLSLKVLAYGSIPVLLVALLFTWSRASLVALVATAGALVLTLGGLRALQGAFLAVAGVAITVLSGMAFPDLGDRFITLFTDPLAVSSAGRLEAWSALSSWLLRNPDVLLLGVGFQNFHYYVHLSAGVTELEGAHSTYLHILTENGIPGLIVFLVWLAVVLLWLRAWRRTVTEPIFRTVPAILFSMMIGVAVGCVTLELLAASRAFVPFHLHLYLLLGICLSHYRTTIAERFLAQSDEGPRLAYES